MHLYLTAVKNMSTVTNITWILSELLNLNLNLIQQVIDPIKITITGHKIKLVNSVSV